MHPKSVIAGSSDEEVNVIATSAVSSKSKRPKTKLDRQLEDNWGDGSSYKLFADDEYVARTTDVEEVDAQPKRKRRRKNVTENGDAEFNAWFQNEQEEELTKSPKRKRRTESLSDGDENADVWMNLEESHPAETNLKYVDELEQRRNNFQKQLENHAKDREYLRRCNEVAATRSTLLAICKCYPMWTRTSTDPMPEYTEDFAGVDWPLVFRLGGVFDCDTVIRKLWLQSGVFDSHDVELIENSTNLVSELIAATRVEAVKREMQIRSTKAMLWMNPIETEHQEVIPRLMTKLINISELISTPSDFIVTDSEKNQTRKLLDNSVEDSKSVWNWVVQEAKKLKSITECQDTKSVESDFFFTAAGGNEQSTIETSRNTETNRSSSVDQESHSRRDLNMSKLYNSDENKSLYRARGKKVVVDLSEDEAVHAERSIDQPSVAPSRKNRIIRKRKERLKIEWMTDDVKCQANEFLDEDAELSGDSEVSEGKYKDNGGIDDLLDMIDVEEGLVKDAGREAVVKALYNAQLEERDEEIFGRLFEREYANREQCTSDDEVNERRRGGRKEVVITFDESKETAIDYTANEDGDFEYIYETENLQRELVSNDKVWGKKKGTEKKFIREEGTMDVKAGDEIYLLQNLLNSP